MRAAADFRLVGRRGVKSGRKTVVVSVALTGDANSMAGFAVSKAVGVAVVRNRVKRRLRAIVAQELPSWPTGTKILVRALPAAGQSDYASLERDVLSGLRQSRDRVAA